MLSARSSRTAVNSDYPEVAVESQVKPLREGEHVVHLPYRLQEDFVPCDDHEAEMTDACEAGDYEHLHQILQDNDYLLGLECHSSPMLTYSLFATAIEKKYYKILRLLLTAHPSVSMCNAGLLELAFANPDLEIFKALHARSSDIVHFSFDDVHVQTAFGMACECSDPMIPNYFLDNGITAFSINEGGLFGTGPLSKAIQMGQPLWLIERMISTKAMINYPVIMAAIKRQDLAILGLVVNDQPDGWDTSDFEAARETGNDAVIAMIEDAARLSARREREREHTCTKAPKEAGKGRRWWQSGRWSIK